MNSQKFTFYEIRKTGRHKDWYNIKINYSM